ncbi:hypothetical protein B1759_16675 [Rubrivirga sp. SAORIC476]|nr:hypothetical protein B1759_16675 [Rubrivirga sp. SAORIC476]
MGGLPQAVLCGARTVRTVERLREAAEEAGGHIETGHQSAGTALLPTRVVVRADAEETLERVAVASGVGYVNAPPAWHFASMGGDVGDYVASRPPRTGALSEWASATFDPERLAFNPVRVWAPTESRVLGRHVEPISQRTRFFLWEGSTRKEVDKDWGRYAALSATGARALAYDRRRFILGVPARLPLPRVLARSLCLCSGYAPAVERSLPGAPYAGQVHLLFRWVPPSLAEAVAIRVSQRPVDCEIDILH